MKKTQRKDASRNIRKRIVSYLSVCLVTMLGLGGLFITRYMGAGINEEATRYYNEHGFKNYELISSLGISDDDIEQIAQTEGVIDVEGIIRTGGSLTKGDLNCSVDLITLTERISVPELVEGRFPVAKDECILAEDFAEVKGLRIGDEVKLAMTGSAIDSESSDPDKRALLVNDFTVTGLMKHPDYLRRKSVDVVGLPWAAFNMDYLGDFHSHALVRTEEPEGVDIFSDKYFKETAETKQRLEELAGVLEVDSLERTKEKSYEELDRRWQEALDEFDEAQAEIDENEANLNAELDAAIKDLNDAQAELDEKVREGNEQIKKAEEEIEAGEKEIEDNEQKIKAGEKEIKKNEQKIKDNEKKIKDNEKKIKDNEQKIKDSEQTVKDNEKKIKDAEKTIKDKEKELRDAEDELNENKERLKTADEKLPEAKKYVEDNKAYYEGEMEDVSEKLAYVEQLLDRIDGIVDTDSEEFRTAVNELADFFIDNGEKIRNLNGRLESEEAMELAEKIRDITGLDGTGILATIAAFDVDRFLALAEEVKNDGGVEEFLSKAREYAESIQAELDKLKEYEDYIKKYEENREDLYNKVAEKEDELDDAKEQLASAKEELKDAKNKLKAAKEELKDGKDKLAAGKEKLESAKDKLAAGKAELAEGKRDLAAGKKELAAGKRELAEGKRELAAGKRKLASEKSKAEAEIRDGWNLYYAQKEDYEGRLQEAKDLLAENREEAEEKIDSLREDIENIKCKWLVLDRRANAGYVDAKSNISAINKASLVFGILFLLISAIVCFSTLSIIIEEQKKMVGTVKAFGFHKGEILGKYLMFGVSAAVAGSIAGILLALGLSGVVLNAYYNSGMYQFDPPRSVVTVGITVIACLIMIAICALATVIACTDILRSPASVLMKGGTTGRIRKKKEKKTSASRRGGSLYSRLIIRNMLDDKARVAISIIIIAFSTMLVGTGISMKLAFDGMTEKQVSDIYKYDVRVDLGDDIRSEDYGRIEKIFEEAGADYTPASFTSHVFRLNDRLDAVNVLVGDPEELGEFFSVRDSVTGEELELPAEGFLVQKKMKESYGMGTGTTLALFSDELDECSGEVTGVFQNYVGRLIITSPEGYEKAFGDAAADNCYYVKLNGADINELKSEVLAAKDDASFEVAAEFVKKFETVALLYNLIVIITTAIAILMSFMILSNLANIFLNRKKTELSVMRINGFSIKQTKGYLTRETVITTAIGTVLGVLAGAIATPHIIRAMEQPDLQFIRTFHVPAWVIAVALEALFAIVIYSIVFRKVKDLNLRDVT